MIKKLLIILILFSTPVFSFDMELFHEPSADIGIGMANNALSLSIGTEVPFLIPTFLKIRYTHVPQDEDDVASDIFSMHVCYRHAHEQSSGYRLAPYAGLGFHYLHPDHDEIAFHGSYGFNFFIGAQYKLMPFHAVFVEAGGMQLKYKPKNHTDYSNTRVYINAGYRFIF